MRVPLLAAPGGPEGCRKGGCSQPGAPVLRSVIVSDRLASVLDIFGLAQEASCVSKELTHLPDF